MADSGHLRTDVYQTRAETGLLWHFLSHRHASATRGVRHNSAWLGPIWTESDILEITSLTPRGSQHGPPRKTARTLARRAPTVAKQGFIARIWTDIGRICMARRDEARHALPAMLSPPACSARVGTKSGSLEHFETLMEEASRGRRRMTNANQARRRG